MAQERCNDKHEDMSTCTKGRLMRCSKIKLLCVLFTQRTRKREQMELSDKVLKTYKILK